MDWAYCRSNGITNDKTHTATIRQYIGIYCQPIDQSQSTQQQRQDKHKLCGSGKLVATKL